MSSPEPKLSWWGRIKSAEKLTLGGWTWHKGQAKVVRVKVLNREYTCDWMPSPTTGKPIRCSAIMEASTRIVIQWGSSPKVRVPYLKQSTIKLGRLYIHKSSHYGCVYRAPLKRI